jgi:hypothetical protein
MKFLHQKFQGKKKEIVEVQLSKPTRVKFMTASEFKRYTGARTHTFFGGMFNKGKVRFVLPFDSVWTVAIDAPNHVLAALDEAEAEALSEGGRNEG